MITTGCATVRFAMTSSCIGMKWASTYLREANHLVNEVSQNNRAREKVSIVGTATTIWNSPILRTEEANDAEKYAEEIRLQQDSTAVFKTHAYRATIDLFSVSFNVDVETCPTCLPSPLWTVIEMNGWQVASVKSPCATNAKPCQTQMNMNH